MASSPSPKVFMSYSHDSEQHKEWVRRLAERLCSDGVDIVLDQWEVGPGDDVTSFMERALSSCDRVLIVCTEEYIKKANSLQGGVGYERMIVTAEIARHLETRRFIPILRHGLEQSLPRFLGPRIYVDLREGDIDESQYEVLLRALLEAPKHMKPAIGRSRYSGAEGNRSSKREEIQAHDAESTDGQPPTPSGKSAVKTPEVWRFHWHRAVHEYCGFKLHLILLRFGTGSIFMKDSVVADLHRANLFDFMIFHLFSEWDLLIRVWADDETVQLLKNRFIENIDLHRDQEPEVLVVQELTHFPETDVYPDTRDVSAVLGEIGIVPLKDVQDKGTKSKYFDQLRNAGLVLEQTVGFHPDRVQFYITIRSMYPLEAAKLKRLKEHIAQLRKIRNRSIYVTVGSSIRAVVKGQAEDYYDINEFLRGVTKELASGEVVTETMLVASRDVHISTRVDFDRADAHMIEYELRTVIPELGPGSLLPPAERWKLIAKYVEIREKLPEDRQGVLIGLIRAKVRGSAEELGRLLTFFPPFEDKLRQRLVPLVIRLYGKNWQTTIDDLKSKEGVAAKKAEDLTFGDLCKIYKRIVLEKQTIDISPLSKDEFCSLMDAAPAKRNDFAHREPDLKRWDELFSFCSVFVPIYSRLSADIDTPAG